jgi:hypothetical protein
MKRAAGLFSGLEKTGCHEIAVRNPAVIDCEIAFPGVLPPDPGGGRGAAPRVDLATVEPAANGEARLVFWEAKHYSNGELRAERGMPPVCRQIATYRGYLAANGERILQSYRTVAANLLAISTMGGGRPISPLIAQVARNERTLTLGQTPKVGLIVFGFDAAQRDSLPWQRHLKQLRADIVDVLAVGNARMIRL